MHVALATDAANVPKSRPWRGGPVSLWEDWWQDQTAYTGSASNSIHETYVATRRAWLGELVGPSDPEWGS